MHRRPSPQPSRRGSLRPRRERAPRAVALFTLACALGQSLPAAAQPRAEDRVAAESLFAEGRQLLSTGDYAAACTKLEASRRLEPALGTSLNLADCYEKLGRTASAWAEFKSAAAEAQKSGDALRKAAALDRANALEPRLCRLRVTLEDPGVAVLQNNEPLSPAVIGSAIPVDPGVHRFEANAPGKIAWSQSFEVREPGALVEVHVPALVEDITIAPTPQPVSEPPPAMSSDSDHAALAWTLGGVGVGALAAGAVFGALASSSWSKAKDSCVDYPYECSPQALDHADSARTQATLATVGFALGGAALGASVVLFVLDHSDPESAEVALGADRVTLRGRF
jgi:tetratricopeptide (TPR) repeat protein